VDSEAAVVGSAAAVDAADAEGIFSPVPHLLSALPGEIITALADIRLDAAANLLEACPLALVRADADRRVRYCNPSFEHIFQFSKDDAEGQPLELLIGLQGTHARRKDGATVDVEYQTQPELSDGVCVGYWYVFQDVTAHRTAQRELRRTTLLFEMAFRSSPATVSLSCVRDGRIIDVNDTWVRLTGYTREEAIGRVPLELNLLENPEDGRRLNRLVALDGGVRDQEVRVRARNGAIHTVSMSIEEFDVDGESLRVVVANDLTSLRQSEARLSDVSRKLLNAQELERLRIGRELHDDIGQRLAILLMQLVHIEREVVSGQPAAPSVHQIGDQIAAVAKDVRRISHALYSPQLHLLDLSRTLKNLCADMQKSSSITVAFTSADVPSSVPGDVALCVYRVAQEGLANAVKYSKTPRIDVELRGEAATLDLTIRDMGCGFDTTASHDGLGLMSMRERVHAIGGEFSVQSIHGQGTTLFARVRITRPT
jgi:PAS domain S-box-containing protein